MQTTVSSDLELNGLELESASLTKLDQTDTKYFNPNNAFDAEGLTALTKITEAKRQERNQTVRKAEVTIAHRERLHRGVQRALRRGVAAFAGADLAHAHREDEHDRRVAPLRGRLLQRGNARLGERRARPRR